MRNWDWDWSWNDLRECQKLWGGLCILYCSYRGGFAPRISTVQNTQAPPEFLTLPQVIPTSTPIPDLISKMYHIIAHLWIAKFIAILLFAILGLQFTRYNTVLESKGGETGCLKTGFPKKCIDTKRTSRNVSKRLETPQVFQGVSGWSFGIDKLF